MTASTYYALWLGIALLIVAALDDERQRLAQRLARLAPARPPMSMR